MAVITIRDKSIRRALHQLLRQTREHQITFRDGLILIDGIEANEFLKMGLSILAIHKWIMPTREGFILTGSGTTLLNDWEQRLDAARRKLILKVGRGELTVTEADEQLQQYEPATDITQTTTEQHAVIREALRVIHNSQDPT